VIPPPSEFLAIEEGRIIRQRAADRTRNAISAAEPRDQPATDGNGSAMSPMEEAFWKELGRDAPAPGGPARSQFSTGFIEQLDLDLHESEVSKEFQKRG
jgi:hypothetical protein